jgi:hypothetical protein
MYHLYIDNQYTRPGIPPGAGNHPSDQWLNAQGYYRVANLPQAPSVGMVWQSSTPPYVLVDGVSTPQGQWVVDDTPQPPQRYSKLKLKRALSDMGLWSQVKAAIEDAGRWDDFVLAQDLSDDDPDFVAMKDVLELDVNAEAILAECKLEG